jgi:hypothetical protein
MKYTKILLTLVALAITTLSLNAQQDGGALQSRINENNTRFVLPQDIKSKLDNFFNQLVKKEYKKGLEDLLLNSPISKKDDNFASILKELQKSINYYGDFKGYEIVDVKVAGTSYYKVKMLGLHQKFPTRWEIIFYRSPDLGLIVSNVKYDDISNIYLD